MNKINREQKGLFTYNMIAVVNFYLRNYPVESTSTGLCLDGHKPIPLRVSKLYLHIT
nr:MAG TPA: hypothetical protein [Caudoviricetes sp.]